MAKTMILLLLVSILVVAVTAASKLSPDAEKFVDGLNDEVKKVVEGVVSAAPPAKQKETMLAALKHVRPINSALVKAKESGDEEKILALFLLVKMTNTMITAAPPEKKLKVMEDNFNSVAAPSRSDCPTVDKAYCETYSKIEKAVNGVVAAAAVSDLDEKAAFVKKTMYPVARSTINKAYADGDEKKIAKVLAVYSKAADEVIAAAPAEKLKVMDKTFAAATATAAAGN